MSSQRRRRLLVISFHFPPDGSVGGLRWAGMSKYLARAGWEVHVITAAPAQREPRLSGVHIHVVPRAKTLNDRYASWAQRHRSRSTESTVANSEAAAHNPSVGEHLGRLRRTLAAALVLPDNARGWLWRAAVAARDLLNEHEFNAVVTSGPPHSSHLVGRLVCIGRSEQHWVDMRDPWAVMDALGTTRAPFDSPLMGWLLPRLERFVFAGKPRVVCNTAEFAEVIQACYPGLGVAYVPNGVDLERLPTSGFQKFNQLTVAYAGTLYANRDLSGVVTAMGEVVSKYPQAAGSLRLRIAGSMEGPHAARFWAAVDAAMLRDIVEWRGLVSPAEALELLGRSHLALVLAQNQPKQVPAKLYECVAMGLPTLVIAESTSSSAREAHRIGAATSEPGDIAGIVRILERVLLDQPIASPTRGAISYEDIAERWDALLRGVSDRETERPERAAVSTASGHGRDLR